MVRRGPRGARALVALPAALVVLLGCSAQGGTDDGAEDGGAGDDAAAGREVALPPADARWDIQLGGPRDVPEDVSIVERDRTAEPTGGYDICYVNGFQGQPDEEERWADSELILRDDSGEPVIDEVWQEYIFDITTPENREALVDELGPEIEGCADDGFDAVELDNLDSFSRSGGRIAEADADAYAELLVDAAHEAGLAAGQKNRAGWDGTSVGYDFAVVEECGAFSECDAYVEAFGDHVLIVEYTEEGFEAACDSLGGQVPIVFRDVELAPDGEREWCD
ncbi:endo alpha-1,4 polygalactosaminidase [Nocardioides zeae]|uniref:Endo alpha-1,4 polygalactosaminidase n=1 Tax=Nocardioides imazamoxiresistens TaxID=3231893 RepID=A0ABU3Q0T8_9ACTN|nr:endo alpha-1,4 polygalactosaminidase [Nocardioides zeae]MDT9595128.1 endo alpha-1,4 polygalactosaminidase [Nocardioides zeae]